MSIFRDIIMGIFGGFAKDAVTPGTLRDTKSIDLKTTHHITLSAEYSSLDIGRSSPTLIIIVDGVEIYRQERNVIGAGKIGHSTNYSYLHKFKIERQDFALWADYNSYWKRSTYCITKGTKLDTNNIDSFQGYQDPRILNKITHQ